MTPIRHGATAITKLYRGTTEIAKVYRGDTLVYSSAPPASPPTVRSVSSLAESGGAGNPRDINRPSPAPVAGDLLLFVQMMSSGDSTEAGTMTPPSGFTSLAVHTITATSNVDPSMRISYKVATDTEPTTYQYQSPTGYSNRADMICIKDWDQAASPPVAYNLTGVTPTNAGTNPDTYNLPSVTPANDNGLLLYTIGTRTTTATTSHGFNWDWSGSGGLTEITDVVANNLVTMSTAAQDWPTADAATGKKVVLNRSTAEDRAAVVVGVAIPGVTTSGGGGGGGGTPTTGYMRGVVIAGGEYGDNGSAYENSTAAGGMSYTNPGVYGSDYLYAAAGDFTYLKSRMPTRPLAKVMVRMERLTSGLNGALRSQEITRITDILDGAAAAGVGVILCPWNFGAVWTDNGSGTATRQALGGTTFTFAAFNDFWTRVMNQWGNHSALVAVELMTEPVAMPAGNNGSAARTWELAAQSALDAIRAVSSAMFVWVPTYGWGIDEIGAHANGPWISDATGNFGYAGHQYNYNRGGSQTDYANALQSAIDQGYTAGSETDALHAREVQSANSFKTWLGPLPGIISEYGIPQAENPLVSSTDAPKWKAYGERILQAYDTHGWSATIWNAGRVLNADTLYATYYPSGGWNTNINSTTGIASVVEAHPSTSDSTSTTLAKAPTNGSGGSKTNQEAILFQAVQGARVSSRYHRYAGHLTGDGPYPLVIHLHGDGAYEYENPNTWTSPQYMDVARGINGIGIIPLTPDTTSGFQRWWQGYEPTYWLVDLIAELKRTFNVDTNRMFISGFSGGAVVTTANLVADWPEIFGGGGAMMLGGGGPYTTATAPTATLQSRFYMRWHVGDSDDGLMDDGVTQDDDGYDALTDTLNGEAKYRADGWNTRRTLITGSIDHAESESYGPGRLQALIDEFKTDFGF